MDTIDQVRAFNRFYTRQIGLVERSYLGSGLSLSELNVLYELAQPDPPTARALSGDLGLDEGYLSRILGGFVKKGWLDRVPDPKDARKSLLQLTAQGRNHANRFAEQARESLGAILSDLNAAEKARLIEGMKTVQDVLKKNEAEVVLRDLQPGDIGWLIQKHAELYLADEGFDQDFEALVAEILADFLRNRNPLNERAFIAEKGGHRLGSVFCVQQTEEIAKLRLFLLVPEARGMGLGKTLLEACMGFAREKGYRRLVLWTHKSHEAACALYVKYGFEMTKEEPVHEFGVDLIRQNWEIDL